MQDEDSIKLRKLGLQSPTLTTYLKSSAAIWYWATIIVGGLAVAFVFIISENDFPWIYIRNVLGIFFVFFLPGYAFLKVISTNNEQSKTSKENLENIELIVLSIGMSIALVSIMGLLLYYSPWGLDLYSIVFFLFGFSLVFSTIAIIRDSRKNTKFKE